MAKSRAFVGLIEAFSRFSAIICSISASSFCLPAESEGLSTRVSLLKEQTEDRDEIAIANMSNPGSNQRLSMATTLYDAESTESRNEQHLPMATSLTDAEGYAWMQRIIPDMEESFKYCSIKKGERANPLKDVDEMKRVPLRHQLWVRVDKEDVQQLANALVISLLTCNQIA